jgi:pimeloyl-ACP methyl ester carboxylesterase
MVRLENRDSEMPYVNNGPVRIHYEVIGDGPPLVLHHGFTQSTRRWHFHGYVDALKADYRLILVDARGHGLSDKPHDTDAYRCPVMASDVVVVLNALAIDRARYWGFSMGGRVGFELASIAPERMGATIIGGSHPFGRSASLITLDGSDPDAFVTAFFTRLGVDPNSLPPAIREDILSNDFKALAAAQRARPSVESALPDMKGPTLVYVGDKDPMHADAERCMA